MKNRTIAAIATPPGNGGVGIVRISGSKSVEIARSIFRRSCGRSEGNSPADDPSFSFKSHHLYYGHIIDPESGAVVDEVLVVAMLAPRSYTAEDVVEIQAHAGAYVMKSILDILTGEGAELADPGEFTKRAFMNGRIDLAQAEAVIDVINARTAASLAMAQEQMSGAMGEEISGIRKVLIDILTEIEAVIDFPDDVGDILDGDAMLRKLRSAVTGKVSSLLARYENAHFLRDGLKLVIVGPPNAGKSSLMNLLVNRERSIVTPVPGTTRDLIEDAFNLNGMPMVITDTAGLHDTDDPVESIGIERAEASIDAADMILYVIDAQQGVSAHDRQTLTGLSGRDLVLVVNKTDRLGDGVRMAIPDELKSVPAVHISAKENLGIDGLKDCVTEISMGKIGGDKSSIVPNLRHKGLLDTVMSSVSTFSDGVETQTPFELLAIDLEDGIAALGEIIGDSARPDILDNIFSNFCIGK